MNPAANDLHFPPEPSSNALPNNQEAEQALLGCIMYDNAAYERLSDQLKPAHFYEPFHARLFAAMEEHIRKGQLAEPIVLMERFRRDEAFEELGGIRYLADLLDRAPPAANARDYGEIIHGLAIRRELIRIAGEVGDAAAKDHETAPRDLLEAAEGQLYALAETGQREGGIETFAAALAGAIEMYAEAYRRDGTVSGLSTGLIDLDQKLGGLHPSDLIIIAARPSMGKTALATNIAFHLARTYVYEPTADGGRQTVSGAQVLVFSLEMSKEQLAGRILAEVSGVASDRLRRGEIDQSEFGRVRDSAVEIQEAPLFIDATGGINIAKLAARARRHKRSQGLDLIVVDYLQLITTGGGNGRRENRTQEVSEITGGLKALAKELNVPIVALSQLSRNVENREDKRPQLSDLRESGSIEQDADAVLFIYREAYYLGRTEPKMGSAEHLSWAEQMSQVQGLAEIIIGKQRHGPIGTVRVSFSEETTKFGNLAREGRYDQPDRGFKPAAPSEPKFSFADTPAARKPYGADDE